MNMSHRIIFLATILVSNFLNAMERPLQEQPVFTLVSFDNERFNIPLEIAAASFKVFGTSLEAYLRTKTSSEFPLAVSSKTLAALAQFTKMLYENRDRSLAKTIEKAEKEISIPNNYEFAMLVKYLQFEPGIDLISEKYEKAGDYSLPKNYYAYYMNLIQGLNPKAYKKLNNCEADNGWPCLEIALDEENEGVRQGGDYSLGYPILRINPGIHLWAKEDQKKYLKGFLKDYTEEPIVSEVSEDELKTVMNIIKELAPKLYDAILKVDPTGADHIVRNDEYGPYNFTASASGEDGLPLIELGSETAAYDMKAKRYFIAHELGHYALGHVVKEPIKVHKVLEKVPMPMKERLLKIGKEQIEVGGHLQFKKAFKHAFSREVEFEADRFAVIEFGIPLDEAIAAEKASAKLESSEEPETFKRTHPHSQARINQLEDLRREIELYKAQKRQPKPIDWTGLAAQYLKEYQEESKK
jgi:hypothetical protein